MKKSRKLKVVRSFSRQPRARLPLTGLWLEQAGFRIGMQVEVIVREECLVIIPSRGSSAHLATTVSTE